MVKVTIYTTTTCPYCKMEKEYLDAKGVKYETVVIDHDKKAAQEMLEKSGQLGVPFTVITKEDGHSESILGFDREKLDDVLGFEKFNG